jgi:hypothetical protein
VEAHLCRRNNGHLIRIVGPAFELVSAWADAGIPLRIVLHGIDRTVERRSRKGPQRRPLRVEFCEADVLDAFDEWRRAVGVAAPPAEATGTKPPSLGSHLERALLRLTNARATNTVGSDFDALIDELSHVFSAVKEAGRHLKGDRRQAIVDRLQALDAEMLVRARRALTISDASALTAQAETELIAFRERLTVEAYARAREAALDRLVRDRFSIPTLAFV